MPCLSPSAGKLANCIANLPLFKVWNLCNCSSWNIKRHPAFLLIPQHWWFHMCESIFAHYSVVCPFDGHKRIFLSLWIFFVETCIFPEKAMTTQTQTNSYAHIWLRVDIWFIYLYITAVEFQKRAKQKYDWKTQHKLYFWKDGGSRMSNVTFPFNSAPDHSTFPHNVKKSWTEKCSKDPTYATFLKCWGFKDVKCDIPMCQYQLFTSSFQAKFLKIRFTKVTCTCSVLMYM